MVGDGRFQLWDAKTSTYAMPFDAKIRDCSHVYLNPSRPIALFLSFASTTKDRDNVNTACRSKALERRLYIQLVSNEI